MGTSLLAGRSWAPVQPSPVYVLGVVIPSEARHAVPLRLSQKVEHLAVEFAAAEVLVRNVGPARVEHAE